MCSSDIFLGLIAILFPPVAVWVKRGICSVDSIINILLCMLGFIPGLLHAWYIIAKFPDSDIRYDYIPDSEARVTYVVVQEPNTRNQRMPKNGSAGAGAGAGYGTTVQAPTVQQQQNGTWATAGEGSSSGGGNAVPPTYEQAVRGDHKVQTHD